MTDEPAIREAIHVFKYPANLRRRRDKNLHSGMLDLIKAAAGHDETVLRLSETEHVAKELISEAAKHYLRGLISGSRNNPYATLGLSDAASPEDIKAHKRWLLKWLHPDRNPSQWETGLFKKVSAAAELLEGSSVIVPPPRFKKTKSRSVLRRSLMKAGPPPRPINTKMSMFIAILKPILLVLIITVAANVVLEQLSRAQLPQALASRWLAAFKDN
jgi:DnaJ domain